MNAALMLLLMRQGPAVVAEPQPSFVFTFRQQEPAFSGRTNQPAFTFPKQPPVFSGRKP